MPAPLHQLMASAQGLPCGDEPDLYFSDSRLDRRYAARRCGYCPLLLPCRLYAVQTEQQWGVWGGVDMQAAEITNAAPAATDGLRPAG